MLRVVRICLKHQIFSRILRRRMSVVYVRSIPGEERLEISFEYGHRGCPAKVFNMNRLQSETLSATLTRLETNIRKLDEKKNKKAKKKGQDVCAQEIDIQMFKDGSKIPQELPVLEAFVQGASLDICGTRFRVEVNPPSVKAIVLPKVIMSGFPVLPKLDLEFANLDECSFMWSRVKYDIDQEQTQEPEEAATAQKKQKTAGSQNGQIVESVEVSREALYEPNASDIGYRLQLKCIPKQDGRTGSEFESVSKSVVSAGPGLCPFEKRHVYTQDMTEEGVFRVMTYNLLADLYADSDFSREHLYPYCPPYALEYDYRKQLILKELAGYNADLMCLQEVDSRAFMWDLLPALGPQGYEGVFKVKGGTVAEGCATFYRSTKFRCVDQRDVLLNEVLESEDYCEDIKNKVYSKEALKEVLQTRTTALQVVMLESLERPGKTLMVANTHLYFHPKADHVRVIQTLTAMRYIEKLIQGYTEEGKHMSLIFCGDFNSNPNRGVLEFMTTKKITETNEDWINAGDDQYIPNMNFTHNLKLASGCGIVPYTNFVGGFHGMLDYIYYDLCDLEVTKVVPPPDHEDVIQYIALPNVVFPSDHIAQICDLKWKS